LKLIPLTILILSVMLLSPTVVGGSSATELYLHSETCSAYPTPCVTINENGTLASSPTAYTMNRSFPVLYLGLIPVVSATGITVSGGTFALRLFVGPFTVDPTIDPSYLKISIQRGSTLLANQTFIFSPATGENDFNFANVPASSGAPNLSLTLNLTGSSITKMSFYYDSPGNSSRLSTPGFQYTGIASLTPATVLLTASLIVIISWKTRNRRSPKDSSA
jgi:hypothetical protein